MREIVSTVRLLTLVALASATPLTASMAQANPYGVWSRTSGTFLSLLDFDELPARITPAQPCGNMVVGTSSGPAAVATGSCAFIEADHALRNGQQGLAWFAGGGMFTNGSVMTSGRGSVTASADISGWVNRPYLLSSIADGSMITFAHVDPGVTTLSFHNLFNVSHSTSDPGDPNAYPQAQWYSELTVMSFTESGVFDTAWGGTRTTGISNLFGDFTTSCNYDLLWAEDDCSGSDFSIDASRVVNENGIFAFKYYVGVAAELNSPYGYFEGSAAVDFSASVVVTGATLEPMETPTPEPALTILTATGLLGVIGIARRRRRQTVLSPRASSR